MAKEKEKEISIEPKKHQDGRYMYNNEQLILIIQKLPAEKQAKLLLKAINMMQDQNRPRSFAIAHVLGCGYDDAGFWWRDTKIKVPKK